MNAPRPLLNAIAFQLGWIACVAGGNHVALLAAALLLPLHALYVSRVQREWLLAGAIAVAGLAMDLGWQALGLLRFAGGDPLPPWLVVLWLLFAQALFHSLAWLQPRPVLAAVLGAVAGPASYLAGLRFGAAETVLPAWQVALAMAPAWAAFLPGALWLARDRRTTPVAPVIA